MPEWLGFLNNFEGMNVYDLKLERWARAADEALEAFGSQIFVDSGNVVPLNKPRLTYGAYSCYAGVTKTDHGLYFFHLFENQAYNELVAAAGNPISGVVGGIPKHIDRKGPNQFQNQAEFKWLNPKGAAQGGFNILALPGNEIVYSAGYYNHTDRDN